MAADTPCTHTNRDPEVEHLPASREFHVGIKKSSDLARGSLPALDARTDKALPLLVAHHLHQPRVSFVDIFLQRRLQFL